MYIEHSVTLSDGQKQRLRAAVNAGRPITLRLAHHELTGPDRLKLTQRQVAHLQKAAAAGTGAQITFSATQLKQNGGFLNVLLPVLAAAAGPIINGIVDRIRKSREASAPAAGAAGAAAAGAAGAAGAAPAAGGAVAKKKPVRRGRGLAQAGYQHGYGIAQAGFQDGYGLGQPGYQQGHGLYLPGTKRA